MTSREFFLVEFNNRLVLFDCSFDEALDDYPDRYMVYLMPQLSRIQLDSDWKNLPQFAAAILGPVAVRDLSFDESKRKTIDFDLAERFPTLQR